VVSSWSAHKKEQQISRTPNNSKTIGAMMLNIKILAVVSLVIFSGMRSASAVHDFQRDAASGSSSGLRGGGEGRSLNETRNETRVPSEAAGECELSLKKMCASGGKDWGFFLEVDLDIYHADSNGEGHWEGFTKEPYVFLPKNGCININKDVSPIGAESYIEVRVKEHDFFSTDVARTKFEDVCNGTDLVFATEHGDFTFVLAEKEKGVLNIHEVSDYIINEWPGNPALLFTHLLESVADPKYITLPDSLAKTIWNDSGLGDMDWTESVFDCDDFATVYKAAALKAGYNAGSDYSYAVWLISGISPDLLSGHATNVYINESKQVKILEPQNGRVVDGKDWDYIPYVVLMH
jgi:hypothetical protein